MGELDGRVAVVTGAGHGIGREIALAMAAEGASVVVNDLGGSWKGEGADQGPASRVVSEIEADGGRAIADGGDVGDSEQMNAVIGRASEELGSVDIVVNTAGILRDKMIFSMTDEDWDLVHRVHLRGHFTVTRAACQYWRAKSKEAGAPIRACVIHFASEAGLYGNLGQANYASAKAGIVSFATAVARDMQRYGVTSNVVVPRARTRLVESTVGGILPGVPEDGSYYTWDPANIVPTAVFLASDRAAGYSGQIIVCGGGVLQLIAPFRVEHEASFEDHRPSLDEIGTFLAEHRGPEAGPEAFPLPIKLDSLTREAS